ncbi:MAG: peptidylprolyl isomerase [Acidobacteria bacterium]|nr:peptidylprolyl isomerase [Acidobacteriota bacterium]
MRSFPFSAAARAVCPLVWAGLAVPVAAAPAVDSAPTASVRVELRTDLGPIELELDPVAAPETVARFLARAGLAPVPEGVARVFPYAGSWVCELRAHGFVTFGCAPYELAAPKPKGPGIEPPTPDEIDAVGLGLGRRPLGDEAERHWLWQSEVIPRYAALREQNRPVPPGLEGLVAAIRQEGVLATSRLDGATRMAYLEALGYRYTSGRSARPVERGAVLTVNLYPGEADERFMIALAPIPDREGRGTVFGRVVAGWETLAALERLPVAKGHRPLAPIRVLHVTRVSSEDDAGTDER